MVAAKIGRVRTKLLVDSGADCTTISEDMAIECGLLTKSAAANGDSLVATLGNVKISLKDMDNNRVKIKPYVEVYKTLEAPVLGLDVLVHCKCTLRNMNSYFPYLEIGDTNALPRPVLPVFYSIDINGEKASGIFDTGANDIYLPERMGRKCHLQAVEYDQAEEVRGFVEKSMATRVYRNVAISYLSKTFTVAEVVVDEDEEYGVFGTDLIRQFHSMTFSAEGIVFG